MEAFAGRARAELRATGERARPRQLGAPDVLTPQEAQTAWSPSTCPTGRSPPGCLSAPAPWSTTCARSSASSTSPARSSSPGRCRSTKRHPKRQDRP